MYGNNLKVMVFLIGFILSVAMLTGAVSAITCINPGCDIPAVKTETAINYTLIETNNDPAYINAENLVKMRGRLQINVLRILQTTTLENKNKVLKI